MKADRDKRYRARHPAECRERVRRWRARVGADDVRHLREYDPETELGGIYTSREVRVRVTYMVVGPAFGVPEGWCVMSIAKVRLNGGLDETRGWVSAAIVSVLAVRVRLLGAQLEAAKR